MNLDKIISTMQSNIARRGVELADLESLYSIRKALAYTKPQYKLVRALRAEIKPLAKAQKFDRLVLHELTSKRTEAQRQVVEKSPLFSIEEVFRVGDIIHSNKFSFS